MKSRKLFFLLLLHHAFVQFSYAQKAADSLTSKITDNYINTVSKKSQVVAEKLDKQTEKYLDKLEKQEARLKNKLSKIDSLAAKNVFSQSEKQYQDLKNKLRNKSSQLLKNTGQYFPWLDSANTSLKYLEGKNTVLNNFNGHAGKIKDALSKVKQLEEQFKQAASVKDFIRQRKEYLKQQLKNYDLGGELKKYNQTAYYYTQQVNEYRQALDDPEKAERKAMQLLNKIPAFQHFMKQYGMLAGLFEVPEDYGSSSVAGLQTIQQVQNSLQTRFASMGPNAQNDVQQSLGAAQAELTKLRNRFPASGGTEDMPDFKPKEQKTKTFLQRLEYGTNIQTVKNNYYFPTTTDMAFSVGYKLNNTNIAGIGASYKMGWGKDIRHIALSNEGIGLRSFVDIKLKGSFFVSGGFEYNYQQPGVSFTPSLGGGRGEVAWQQSGLVGISKIVSLKTKYFKKTKLQLLWDMLSYQQVPRTQAIKFRVGYNF